MERLDNFEREHKGPTTVYEHDLEHEPRIPVMEAMSLALAKEMLQHVVYTKKYVNKVTGVRYNELPPECPPCIIRYEFRLRFIKAYEDKLAEIRNENIKLKKEIDELKLNTNNSIK